MGHSHGHGHSHGGHGHSHGGKADFWTKWNKLSEYVDALGTAYFFKSTIDNFKDVIEWGQGTYNPDHNDESAVYKYTLTGVSVSVAMLLALGAAYCHGILNQQYQDPDAVPEPEETLDESDATHEHAMLDDDGHAYMALNAEENQAIGEIHTDTHGHAHSHGHSHAHPQTHGVTIPSTSDHSDATTALPTEPVCPSTTLTTYQKLLLSGDGICHGAGKAGSFMAITDSFISFAAPGVNNLPVVRLSLQFVGTIFGAGAAVADVRTCKKSLLNHNEAEQHAPPARSPR